MKTEVKSILITIIFSCFAFTSYSGDIIKELDNILKDKCAKIGAAITYGNETIQINNDEKYPIASVFKLHIAITALKKMETEKISLDSMMYIEPEQMRANTYSPLRDKYPNQRIRISYRELIEYSISYSDNNTCDILIDYIGGINVVDDYIKSLGIKNISLTQTEESMHKDIKNCYLNWCSPSSLTKLLKKLYEGRILNQKYFTFLESTLIGCTSGKNKLYAGLPKDVKIAHKTGHADRTSKGMQIADADVGVIYLPNGDKCYIAVLIKDSFESDENNAQIMAQIANIVYTHYSNRF